MEVKNLQNQKGFTLVEIAIVLVIIGLLLGGVLKGQELIENAKVKSLSTQFDNITAAYYAFADRKSGYPDDTSDDSFWYDLKQEGFISGVLGSSTNSDGPTHSFDGTFVFVPAASGNLIPNKGMICAPGVEDKVGQVIDTKTDDGVGSSGTVRGIVESTAGTAVTTGTPTAFTATNASFTVCKSL